MSSTTIDLSPATIAELSKTPMIVPASLRALLLKFKNLSETATLDEVLDAMKDYIYKHTLYDLKNPRVINCQDDALGTVLGTETFTLYEIKKIVLKKLLSANQDILLAKFPVADVNGKRKGGPDGDSLLEAENVKRPCTQSSTACSPLHFYIPSPARYDSASDTTLSIQGYDTSFAKDSSDTDIWLFDESSVKDLLAIEQTYEVEYEVESDSSDGGSVTDTNSEISKTDMDILQAALHSVVCENDCDNDAAYKTDSDKEFWADGSSEDYSVSDVEISESDKWKCGKCGSRNKPHMRFCTKCWDQRVGWLPERHERRQKPRRRARPAKQGNQVTKSHCDENLISSSITSDKQSELQTQVEEPSFSEKPSSEPSAESGSSQELFKKEEFMLEFSKPSTSNENLGTTVFHVAEDLSPSVSLEHCDSGISSQDLCEIKSSQELCESEASQKSQGHTELPSPSQNLCSLCLSKPKNATIIHGNIGHQISCYRCARKLQSKKKPCPICRRTIDRVVHQIVCL